MLCTWALFLDFHLGCIVLQCWLYFDSSPAIEFQFVSKRKEERVNVVYMRYTGLKWFLSVFITKYKFNLQTLQIWLIRKNGSRGHAKSQRNLEVTLNWYEFSKVLAMEVWLGYTVPPALPIMLTIESRMVTFFGTRSPIFWIRVYMVKLMSTCNHAPPKCRCSFKTNNQIRPTYLLSECIRPSDLLHLK